MTSGERLPGLDALRGIASLAVCWFHLTLFTYGTADGPGYALLRRSGSWGWLGVEVFFVLSGFVIPWALHRAGYRLSSYPSFLLKRILRLDPPYLASLGVVLAIAGAHALWSGRAFAVEGAAVTLPQVLLHLGYVTPFFGHAWLNPGYWTLAVELQFYLAAGLLFPALFTRRAAVRRTSLAALLGLSLAAAGRASAAEAAPYDDLIFPFVPLFLLGIVACQRRLGITGREEYAGWLAACLLGCGVTVGLLPSLAAALAVLALTWFASARWRLGAFLGAISYPLYLLHWPVGHWTLSLLGLRVVRAESDAARTLVLLAGLAACLASAWLLHVAVERPAQRWASRVRYGPGVAALARRSSEPTQARSRVAGSEA